MDWVDWHLDKFGLGGVIIIIVEAFLLSVLLTFLIFQIPNDSYISQADHCAYCCEFRDLDFSSYESYPAFEEKCYCDNGTEIIQIWEVNSTVTWED